MRKVLLTFVSVALLAVSGCGFTDTGDDTTTTTTTTKTQAQTPACDEVQKCLDTCPEADRFVCLQRCASNKGLDTAQVRACGEKCGNNFCPQGSYCCNESCGICAEQGTGCIQLYCG